jgi:hydroxyacylglutathione hydrolase
LNIGFGGSMSITATALCDPAETVVAIVYPGEEEAAAQHLSDMGFTDVVGVFPLASGATFPTKLADLVDSTRRTSPRELEQLLTDGAVTVIDVRGAGDKTCGTIAEAIAIPLDALRDRLDSIPTGKPIVVHCAAGGRSSAAASLLRASGVSEVSDLTGGFQHWQRRTRRKAPRR